MTKKNINRIKKYIKMHGIENVRGYLKRNEFDILTDIRLCMYIPFREWDNSETKEIIKNYTE